MTTALVSKQFIAAYGDALKAEAAKSGTTVEFMTLPEEKGARLAQADCDRIDCAFLDREMRFDEQLTDALGDALIASKSAKWLHVSSSGMNPSAYADAVLARGGTITTSTGSNAEPVAQTGFTGLLMLARGFTTYIPGQQKKEWQPLRGASLPNDLRGQTLVLIGVGAVGSTLAGYAKAFGLKVIGVRRSPRQPGDPVDEMVHPSRLKEVLPRADWIVIACPLTSETRNLLDAEAFKAIKKGAGLVNIGRGEVIDEEAFLEAMKSGRLRGAHLDAHQQEPLPVDSPMWDLPNLIVTPHNASASNGNERRTAQMFVDNFGRRVRGEPMFNIGTFE
jgi:phosphoglycerate dehydrogenase-like enzyme